MSELTAKTLYTEFDYLSRGQEFASDKFELFKFEVDDDKAIELYNDDFVVKVNAGLTLEDLDSYLKPFSKTVNIFSAAEYSLSRVLGELRDKLEQKSVLGLTVQGLKGETSKCGGQVIKNVAGYDLRKLYLGSFNSLQVIKSAYLKLEKLPMLKMKLLAAFEDLSEIDFELLYKTFAFDFNNQDSAVKLKFHSDFSVSLTIELLGSPDLLEMRKHRLTKELPYEFISEVETYSKPYFNPNSFHAYYYVKRSDLKSYTEALIRVLDDLEVNPESYGANIFSDISEIPKRVDLNIDLFKSSLSFKSKPYVFRAFHDLEAIDELYRLFKPAIRIAPVTYENRVIERDLNSLIKVEELELIKALKLKYDPENILNPGVLCNVTRKNCSH